MRTNLRGVLSLTWFWVTTLSAACTPNGPRVDRADASEDAGAALDARDIHDDAWACTAGRTLCGASCADTQSDEANCGRCGETCPAATTCVSGECACGPALTLCSDACVDLASSPADCGACGTVCGVSEVCAAGHCVMGACPATTTNCAGACVMLDTSATDCGACGHACAGGQVCTLGACRCATGQLCGSACTDTESDEANCGTCGHVCPGTATCVAGSCVCPETLTRCGDTCVDLTRDRAHCGTCGNACTANATCDASACVDCGPPATLSRDVQPIFNTSCASLGLCHTGAGGGASPSLVAGRSRSALVGAPAWPLCETPQTLVVPGSPSQSHLLNILTGVDLCRFERRMPNGGSLTPAEIATIQSWICRGALND